MTTIDSLTESPQLLDDDTTARVALACAGVAGDVSVSIAIDASGGAGKFVAAVHDGEDRALPLSNLTRARIRTLATGNRVARALEVSQHHRLTVVTPAHEEWPEQLESLGRSAPLVLWVGGDLTVLSTRSAAIVGTTTPTAHGIYWSRELATGLAQRDSVIGTGPGAGINQTARQGALAMGGRVLTVCSAGIDQPATDSGVTVISEMPPEAQATIRAQRRAKLLLMAVTGKTILIEPGASTLQAAAAAHAAGRPIGVVPATPTSPWSAECQEFAATVEAHLVRSISEADRLR